MSKPVANESENGVECMRMNLNKLSLNIVYGDGVAFIVFMFSGIVNELCRRCNISNVPILQIRVTTQCRTKDNPPIYNTLSLITIDRNKLPNVGRSWKVKDGGHTRILNVLGHSAKDETIAVLQPGLSKIISMMRDMPTNGFQNGEILIQPEILYSNVPADAAADSGIENMQSTPGKYAIDTVLKVDKSMGPYICNDFIHDKSAFCVLAFKPTNGTTAESLEATFDQLQLNVYYDKTKMDDNKFKKQSEPLLNLKGE